MMDVLNSYKPAPSYPKEFLEGLGRRYGDTDSQFFIVSPETEQKLKEQPTKQNEPNVQQN